MPIRMSRITLPASTWPTVTLAIADVGKMITRPDSSVLSSEQLSVLAHSLGQHKEGEMTDVALKDQYCAIFLSLVYPLPTLCSELKDSLEMMNGKRRRK
jgi:hypothetical protein